MIFERYRRRSVGRIILVLLAVAIAQQPAGADEHPACTAQHFDADGDGFGWENEATCEVTAETAPPPVHINQMLNAPVELIRPYWDGNHDIANRDIQCDHFIYDADLGRYRPRERNYATGWGPVPTSVTFVHGPIPSESSYLGFLPSPVARNDPSWTVIDGLYYGPSMLAHPYVELVTANTGNKAIRLWFDADSTMPMALAFFGEETQDDGYYECRDLSGADLSPTGRLGQPTQSPAELLNLTLSVTPNTEQQNPDLIINKVTGEPVVLQKAYWDFNRDLAQRAIFCNDWVYKLRPEFEEYQDDWVYGRTLKLPYLFANSGNDITYWKTGSLGGRQGDRTLLIENGVVVEPISFRYSVNLSNFFSSEYVEVGEFGSRAWIDSHRYVQCSVTPSGTP
jgi:hypothetical protein